MMAIRFCGVHHPNYGITQLHNSNFLRSYPNGFSRKILKIRALRREWQEYEEAVKEKDLSRALRFLRDDIPMQVGEVDWYNLQREWQVLDTCLNADDMRLVAAAYAFLKDKGLLHHFGKYQSIVLEGPRDVTPTVLKSSTGLDVTKLSPKKWGLAGTSSFLLATLFAGVSILLNQGIDIRPNIAAVLGLAMLDAILLGGSCLAQISSFWPPYKRRICVHEAGHLLVAYLMGCPIRGVILDPIVAMQMGIQGQAGTQFWDEKLENELAEGRLSGTAFDRYCMVLFAGIAAEALIYGEAEGGENDENLFRSISVLLEPPLSVAQVFLWLKAKLLGLSKNVCRTRVGSFKNTLFWRIRHTPIDIFEESEQLRLKVFACLVTLCFYNATFEFIKQMSNQARWSVLQSYNLLKWHKQAHRAAVKAIESGCSLSMVIKKVEEAMSRYS